MNPEQSKKFLGGLGLSAVFWFWLAALLTHSDPQDFSEFCQIYLFTCLDLIFLLLLFWTIFFSSITQSIKNVQISLFLTFKLVCLVFLAITLKRLRNASPLAIGMGIGFIGLGPLLAAVWMKLRRKQG